MGQLTNIFTIIDTDSAVEVLLFFAKYGIGLGFMLTSLLDLVAYGIYKALSLVNIIKS